MMIHWLGSEACHDAAVVGAKAANLGRLAALHRVPPGFAIPSLPSTMTALDSELRHAVSEAYEELGERIGQRMPKVAVRSSALDEDSVGASFAGQHATFLNVSGQDAVIDAVVRCCASAQSTSALTYRASRGVQAEDIRIAVLVQQLIPPTSQPWHSARTH